MCTAQLPVRRVCFGFLGTGPGKLQRPRWQGLSLRGDTPLPRSAIPRGPAPSALTDQEDLPCILREDGGLSPTIIVMDYRLEKIDISWIKKERIKVVLFRLRNKYSEVNMHSKIMSAQLL